MRISKPADRIAVFDTLFNGKYPGLPHRPGLPFMIRLFQAKAEEHRFDAMLVLFKSFFLIDEIATWSNHEKTNALHLLSCLHYRNPEVLHTIREKRTRSHNLDLLYEAAMKMALTGADPNPEELKLLRLLVT